MMEVASQRGRILFTALLAFCAGLLIVLPPSPPVVWGHAYIAESDPAHGAGLDEPPDSMRIVFTEGIEAEVSRFVLKNSHGEEVPGTETTAVDHVTVLIGFPELPADDYALEWEVLSIDGHVTRGTIHFTLEGDVEAVPGAEGETPSPTPGEAISRPQGAPPVAGHAGLRVGAPGPDWGPPLTALGIAVIGLGIGLTRRR